MATTQKDEVINEEGGEVEGREKIFGISKNGNVR